MQTASATVDWLQFTCPTTLPLDDVLALLEGDGPWLVGRGAHGYRQALLRGEVRVYADGQPSMGVHVQLTGQGCAQLAAEGLLIDWSTYLEGWLDRGARVCRLDLALDDRRGLVTMGRVRRAVNRGEAVSRFRESRRVERQRLTDGRLEGQTWVLGTPSSDAQIRIYDKAAQQGVTGPWTRVELQLRRKRAQAGALRVVQSGPCVAAGLLRSYLNFRQRTANRQRERWPLQPWWGQFLGESDALRLEVPARPAGGAVNTRWLVTQVAPTLARYEEARGRTGVDALLEIGAARQTGRCRRQ